MHSVVVYVLGGCLSALALLALLALAWLLATVSRPLPATELDLWMRSAAGAPGTAWVAS